MYDPRVDDYIEHAASFARPILGHLRKMVHLACPDIVETIKWGFPHFDYKGVYTSMAAFSQHCAFTFWKASLMKDDFHILSMAGENGMGHFGKVRSMADLPANDIFLHYLLEAKRLNDDGIKLQIHRKKVSAEVSIPGDLLDALRQGGKSLERFMSLSPAQRREYIEWVEEAKTQVTREKRIDTTVEWSGEGKERNWKYKKTRQ